MTRIWTKKGDHDQLVRGTVRIGMFVRAPINDEVAEASSCNAKPERYPWKAMVFLMAAAVAQRCKLPRNWYCTEQL